MNSTGGCCDMKKYYPCVSRIQCNEDMLSRFNERIGRQTWRLNALLVINAILTAAIVLISAYGQQFRHHPFTRLVFLGATTLFLPIMSYVVSTSTSIFSYVIAPSEWELEGLAATCSSCADHLELVITWAFLVQVAVINTSVIVATDDREGQNIGPPFELLVQGIWTFYLCINMIIELYIIKYGHFANSMLLTPCLSFALLSAKMVFKYYAFKSARQSIALGHNPRLISGYMLQLQLQEANRPHASSLPPLLVMGEEGRIVEKQPHGYVFKKDDYRTNNTNLVTIDRIWQHLDNMLLLSSSHLKDLCLSFAFFKLLRCRFARYESSNVGSIATLNFFWNLLLEDGAHTRVFRVVVDELSFLHDYYDTSLPISYSKGWLPILSVCISFLSISYCIWVAQDITLQGINVWGESSVEVCQFSCDIWCIRYKLVMKNTTNYSQPFGNMAFNLVPVSLLLLLVVISEVRDISSYVCSNWTKVALISHYVSHPSSPHRMNRWAGLLLKYSSCELLKHWDEKIGQCSVLIFLHQRTSLFVLLRRLLHLPERKTKVKVSPAMKICIIDALRRCNSNGRRLSNGAYSLRQIHQAGENLIWACMGKGTSDIILSWHIATYILEVRYPLHQHGQDPSSIPDHKIVATHLSHYCVYLMTTYPELLPDDDAWSKSLYKAVKKEAMDVLARCHVRAAGSSSTVQLEAKVQKLVTMMCRESKHEVLKNGARLGKQLVEMIEDEETKWKLLAGFWSEMILYVAPSNNLKGHSKALAEGGELITLLWAMLTHAGIVSSSHGGTSGTASAS